MKNTFRLTARVIVTPSVPKTRHFHGSPPEVAGGEDHRRELESPALLVIEQRHDGVFLFRYTADGRCVGDTWHEAVDAAKKQASFEFNDLLSEWKQVPIDIEDVILFGLGTVANDDS